MRVVPQAFFAHPAINTILRDGLCAAIYKTVAQTDAQQDRYLAAHALTVVLEGQLKVNSYDGQFAAVNRGEVIFLPKGLYMVSDIIPEDRPFEAIVFFLDDALLEQFLSQLAPAPKATKMKPLMRMPVANEMQVFIQSLLRLYDSPEQSNPALARLKLQEFLHLLHRSEAGAGFASQVMAVRKRQKKSLTEFMRANCCKPLRIEDYAYLTGRSLSTFHRDFKAIFSQAPKKWLIQQRLDKAQGLLEKQHGSVACVANAVGYENIPHFIKAFRKRFGITPGQYGIQARKSATI